MYSALVEYQLSYKDFITP